MVYTFSLLINNKFYLNITARCLILNAMEKCDCSRIGHSNYSFSSQKSLAISLVKPFRLPKISTGLFLQSPHRRKKNKINPSDVFPTNQFAFVNLITCTQGLRKRAKKYHRFFFSMQKDWKFLFSIRVDFRQGRLIYVSISSGNVIRYTLDDKIFNYRRDSRNSC